MRGIGSRVKEMEEDDRNGLLVPRRVTFLTVSGKKTRNTVNAYILNLMTLNLKVTAKMIKEIVNVK